MTITILMLVLSASTASAQATPTIDEMVSLKRASQPALSPDGSRVAWVVRKANWDDNTFETEIWLADVRTGRAALFTGGKKSTESPAFSPDGSSLAFISDRDGKRQIYVISLSGGESRKLTSGEEGVSRFAWSRDSKRIAFVSADPKSEAMKERQKQFGDVTIEDEATNPSHLHVIGVLGGEAKRLTSGTFVVGSFDWSPDGREIAFDFSQSSDPSFGVTTNISVVDTETAAVRPLVTHHAPPRQTSRPPSLAVTPVRVRAVTSGTSTVYGRPTVMPGSHEGNRAPALCSPCAYGVAYSPERGTSTKSALVSIGASIRMP